MLAWAEAYSAGLERHVQKPNSLMHDWHVVRSATRLLSVEKEDLLKGYGDSQSDQIGSKPACLGLPQPSSVCSSEVCQGIFGRPAAGLKATVLEQMSTALSRSFWELALRLRRIGGTVVVNSECAL